MLRPAEKMLAMSHESQTELYRASQEEFALQMKINTAADSGKTATLFKFSSPELEQLLLPKLRRLGYSFKSEGTQTYQISWKDGESK